ncbi:hypothetical protein YASMINEVIRUS_317 [Yasminevirus sp. GU-2018]|uniref:Glycosyltransferase 2-like domain-containing protein n=1 Tax=Yasminevirus sp. GU-2018 TaxID=2420051 RepID=A0A5K0U8P6_9VIRU|nr:hypothetical protein YASMINEVIRUS_317 [Yasminevirus sp. GU-2018]
MTSIKSKYSVHITFQNTSTSSDTISYSQFITDFTMYVRYKTTINLLDFLDVYYHMSPNEELIENEVCDKHDVNKKNIFIEKSDTYDLHTLCSSLLDCVSEVKYAQQHVIDKIQSIEIKKIELNIKDYGELRKLVTNAISKLQVFTSESIALMLTSLLTRDSNVDKFIELFGVAFVHIVTSQIIETDGLDRKSKLSKGDLEQLSELLATSNVSLRQLVYLTIGSVTHITYHDLMMLCKLIREKIESSTNESSVLKILHMYEQFDEELKIDVVNEIFRPIESVQLKRLIPSTEDRFCFSTELPLCIVVPSYNNSATLKITLDSIYLQTHNQNYRNYRVIFVDDISERDECKIVTDYLNEHKQQNRTLVFRQYCRQRQCAGRYIAYHTAYDDEIILMLDGDDMFYQKTMSIVNSAYSDQMTGLTYGSYVDLYKGVICEDTLKGSECFPQTVIDTKRFRHHKFITAHLRTMYAKLIKRVKLYDLMYEDDKFYKLMTDFAEMMPVLEMLTCGTSEGGPGSGSKFGASIHKSYNKSYFKVIKQASYVYNLDNSLSYDTSYARRNDAGNDFNREYRTRSASRIRSLQPYRFALLTNHSTYDNDDYLLNIVHNYRLDILIVNIVFNITKDEISRLTIDTSSPLQRLTNKSPVYLTGSLVNHVIRHKIKIPQLKTPLNIKNYCLTGVVTSGGGINKSVLNGLKNKCMIIADSEFNKQMVRNNRVTVGYLSLMCDTID